MIVKIQYGDDLRRVVVAGLTLSDLRALCTKSFSIPNPQLKYVDPEGDKVSIVEEEDLQEALRLSANTPLRVLVFDGPARTGPEPTPAGPSESIADLGSLFSRLGIHSVTPNLTSLAKQIHETLSSEEIAGLPEFLRNLLAQCQAGLAQATSSLAGSPEPIKPLHPNVICDGCDGPVIGSRFKCLFCQDFDFCEACKASKPHPHQFLAISSPLSADERPVHVGVQCDECQAAPIRGIRFKCTQCFNFDLCEVCEAKGIHDPEHPLVKIAQPQNQHRGGFPWRGRGKWGRMARTGCRPVPPRYMAHYVEDVTIQDGTVLAAHTSFVKAWKMKNEGGEAWPAGTKLVFIGGDRLGAPVSVVVPSAEPGAEVTVSVNMTAPAEPGRYSSYWRLEDPSGVRFGQRIWADLYVAVQPTGVAPEASSVVAPQVIPTAPPAVSAEQESAVEMLLSMGYTREVIDHAFEAAQGHVATVIQALTE